MKERAPVGAPLLEASGLVKTFGGRLVRTVAEFWTVVPSTPLVLSLAALLPFRRRDITE